PLPCWRLTCQYVPLTGRKCSVLLLVVSIRPPRSAVEKDCRVATVLAALAECHQKSHSVFVAHVAILSETPHQAIADRGDPKHVVCQFRGKTPENKCQLWSMQSRHFRTAYRHTHKQH